MTADWVDDLDAGDEPVAYDRTDVGRVASGYDTLTTAEAALLAGVARVTVQQWARHGVLPGVQVEGVWLFDRAELVACAAERRRRHLRVPWVDAEPLLRQIALRGGDAAVGARPGSAKQMALERARHEGTLTVWAVGRLAVRLLGLTPWDLWGEEYQSA